MNDMKMLILLIVTCFTATDGQVNAEFKYADKCYLEGHTLTLEAVYTGSGTPVTVQWSYSGGTGTNLFVLTSTCTLFGSVPAGYPAAARMEYKCSTTDASLAANTYRLTVKELSSEELKDLWGATFAPQSGTAPAAVQVAIPICAPTPEPDCCFCMIGCPQLHIVLCIILCILIILVVVLVVVIIAGMVVEAIFVILGNMSKTMRIVSFCAFLFGLGLFLTDKIRQRLARRASKRGRNDSTNNSPGDVPLNTKYTNPPGGHAQPDHAQPLQDRPVNFN